jgi:hypothetical protein
MSNKRAFAGNGVWQVYEIERKERESEMRAARLFKHLEKQTAKDAARRRGICAVWLGVDDARN